MQCECFDKGCREHEGRECGRNTKEVRELYRIDWSDRTPLYMCEGCTSDALESGCFEYARTITI
jgi:hypothetical protein